MTFTHKTPNISCLKDFRLGIKILLCSTMLKQRSCGIFFNALQLQFFLTACFKCNWFLHCVKLIFLFSRETRKLFPTNSGFSVASARRHEERKLNARVAQPQSYRLRLGMPSIEAMQLMLFSTLLHRNSLSDFYILLHHVVNSRRDSFLSRSTTTSIGSN